MASTTRLRQAFAPLATSSITQYAPLSRHIQDGLSRRTFSSTRQTLARPGRGNSFVPNMPSMKQPAQKSMNVAIQEQKELAAMPDDIGFMPETFIMPHGRALPSLTSNFSGRYALEKARLLQKAKDLFAITLIKYYYTRDTLRPSPLRHFGKRFQTWFRFPHLQRLQIPKIATSLYEEMYTNFAKGTIEVMRPKLCENIFESLRGRVVARPKNTSLKWTLHRYIGSPKVVSHKFTPLSAGVKDKYKQSILQQAVVRIKSVQSLQRLRKVKGRDGRVTEVLEEGSESEGKEMTEFFVVQRMMRRGVMGEWKVWGMTEEMTLERFEREQRAKLGL